MMHYLTGVLLFAFVIAPLIALVTRWIYRSLE